ncbi:pantoate--beta-alanine ligase [Rhizobium sp. 1AS11]|uniref:pantoate--beta-alanine ligase n=1 Tax=Rhizobium acaciae TaxID=2989736 RepID=UPI0022237517|nr:pantoate--beta-alanine ligase [Rhizobium acaciae]MCW1410690.1 pantoate--beta-alanine ligase [Rhizobium acaciae]MCW1743011.1 pantoate--beta-alanine ligase [Rhizobium acaciae]
MTMPIVRTVEELRETVRHWRRDGSRIAIVPTMGALHEGHLGLVRAALDQAWWVIVTVFVNPKQFNSTEDLAAYPRSEEADAARLAALGVDMLYVPALEEMYPDGFATTVSVSGISEGLCGAHRPGHFDGVATVVTKLFLQSGADVAYLGAKDFQQLQVVRRLVRDLDIPIEIVAHPTVREIHGLAMSSRNALLSPEEHKIAPYLAHVLFDTAARLKGCSSSQDLIETAKHELVAAGFSKVEYLELRAEEDLLLLDRPDRPARLLAAAWLGETRLIDNVAVPVSPADMNAPSKLLHESDHRRHHAFLGTRAWTP